MDGWETLDQSFMIKIWLEEVDPVTGRRVWRGRLTHIASGDRSTFDALAAIPTIIEPYLAAWDVQAVIRPPTDPAPRQEMGPGQS
jgi:hypothetical protein